MKLGFHAHIVDRPYLEDLVATLSLTAQRTPDGKTLYRHRGDTIAWARRLRKLA